MLDEWSSAEDSEEVSRPARAKLPTLWNAPNIIRVTCDICEGSGHAALICPSVLAGQCSGDSGDLLPACALCGGVNHNASHHPLRPPRRCTAYACLWCVPSLWNDALRMPGGAFRLERFLSDRAERSCLQDPPLHREVDSGGASSILGVEVIHEVRISRELYLVAQLKYWRAVYDQHSYARHLVYATLDAELATAFSGR